ncbi:sigma-54 interaction domain-containing protein [Sorangium sp. So ce1182]|uniref:sigma-54 interaction domain-containing protein n=1 Tax=Sorangium sp. So ce1182 TaxID=3133334 RepID=UPI003F63ACA7
MIERSSSDQGRPSMGGGADDQSAAAGRQLSRGHDVTDTPPASSALAERLRAAPGGCPSGATGWCDEAIAASPAMVRIFDTLTKLARSQVPVLLLGETGTGKEVVARAIHQRSARRARPMVSINCAAIPQQLVESALFGHERGAFTGASQQQKGVFEAADGGTVFLDEIGELPAAAQAALLRVLESMRLSRVGSNREIDVNVRLIAATHRDLEAMCDTGGFRSDLLYRINAMTVMLPPLRNRPEDIEALAMHFLRQANESEGRSVRCIDAGALAAIRRYAWPGNARELRNAVLRAVIVAEGDSITPSDLPERVRAAAEHAAPAHRRAQLQGGGTPLPPAEEDRLKQRLKRCEAEIIFEELRKAGWNQTKAASALGISLRALVYKLRELRITRLGYASTDERLDGGDGASLVSRPAS